MNKICTSIKQSKKLIELGIDVKTADMYYDVNSFGIQSKPEVAIGEVWSKDIPAWSLIALMDLMPNVNGHYPELCRGKQTGQYYMWIEDTFDTQMFDNPIDAVFEMVVWLKEKALI